MVRLKPDPTDEARRNAYGTLLSVDEELDAILQQLATLGIDDHTVILLTSDNGVAWGEHRELITV